MRGSGTRGGVKFWAYLEGSGADVPPGVDEAWRGEGDHMRVIRDELGPRGSGDEVGVGLGPLRVI